MMTNWRDKPLRVPHPFQGWGTDSSQRARRKPRGVFFAVALILTTACNTVPHRDQSLQAERNWKQLRARFKFQLATQHFDQSRVDEAVRSIREAVELEPDNPAYYILLAKCYLEQDQLGLASDALDFGESMEPDSAELRYTRGLVAERRWKYEQALQHYQVAATLDPTNVDYVLAVADSMVFLGRPTEACDLIDSRMDDLARDAALLALRADIRSLQGDFEKAAADFAELVACGDISHLQSEQYARVLMHLGHYRKAVAVLRPLIENEIASDEESQVSFGPAPSIVRALATCYSFTGKVSDSRRLLEKHLRLFPEDARSWCMLAESSIKLGDLRRARQCLSKGRRLAPELSQWGFLRAYLALRDGDPKHAADILEPLVVEHPEKVDAHCLLAEAYKQLDRPEAAAAHFGAALKLDPNCPWALSRLRPRAPQTIPIHKESP